MIKTILFYLIVLLFLCYVFFKESEDLYLDRKTKKRIGGFSRHLLPGRKVYLDTNSILLDKIHFLSHYRTRLVVWRKSFIIAALSSFLGQGLSTREVPSISNFVTGFMFIYIIVFGFENYYKYHYDEIAAYQFRENAETVKRRLKLGTISKVEGDYFPY